MACGWDTPRPYTADAACEGEAGGCTHAAVAEVEALGGVAQDLGVEVDEEGADGVLVRLAHPPPQAVLALHHIVPLPLGRLRAVPAQPVRQQHTYRQRLQEDTRKPLGYF